MTDDRYIFPATMPAVGGWPIRRSPMDYEEDDDANLPKTFKGYLANIRANQNNEAEGRDVAWKNVQRAARSTDPRIDFQIPSPPPDHTIGSPSSDSSQVFNSSSSMYSPPNMRSPPSVRIPSSGQYSNYSIDTMISYDPYYYPEGRAMPLQHGHHQSLRNQTSSTIVKASAMTMDSAVNTEPKQNKPTDKSTSSANRKERSFQPPYSPPISPSNVEITTEPAKSTVKVKTPSKKKKRSLQSAISPSLSPSNVASKKLNGKKTKRRWNDDETKILIEVYGKWAKKLRTNKKSTTWELVCRQYLLRCKQESIKSERTAKQISDRVDYLIDQYKKIRDNENGTGKGRKTFKWYDEMSSILEGRSAIAPKNLSESMSDSSIASSAPLKKKCKKSISTLSAPTTRTTPPDVLDPQSHPEPIHGLSQDENNHPEESDDFLFQEHSSNNDPDQDSQVGTQEINHANTVATQESIQESNSSDGDSKDSSSSDDEVDETTAAERERNSRKKSMTKQGAFSELVISLQREMAKQTKEVARQNKRFKKAAEAERKILLDISAGYKADCEANAKLTAAITELLKK